MAKLEKNDDFTKRNKQVDPYAAPHMDHAGGIPGEPEQCIQPVFPAIHNDKERKKWLENVEEWGLWYEDGNIKARYYKYDFPDGSRLIAVKYHYTCPPYMRDNPSQFKENIEADGSYYGMASFHVILSEWYWKRHGDEYRKNYQKYFTDSTIGKAELVKLLKELQIWEKERLAEMEGAYISNEYIMKEFDLDHLDTAKSAVCCNYVKFYKEYNYIPRFFNVKKCKEVTDYAHTLTTSCGGCDGMGSIMVFDAPNEIVLILNNEALDRDEACELVRKVLWIAEPKERERAEEILNMR